MNKIKDRRNPFESLVLDKEEQSIEKALERGEYNSSKNLNAVKVFFREAVANYEELSKTRPITIRVNQADLIKVKSRAIKNNMPYQTLLSTLIHQFAEGKTKIEL